MIDGKRDQAPFEELESILQESNYSIASQNEVVRIFSQSTLFCRSEQFTNVINLIHEEQSLVLQNPNAHANMCNIASGRGFATAMTEGFSGKDVAGAIKSVLTFSGTHLEQTQAIPSTDPLRQTKPDTAAVSRIGSGIIAPEDVQMASFRIPAKFFPEELMSDHELTLLESSERPFIVRHYIPQKEKAVH